MHISFYSLFAKNTPPITQKIYKKAAHNNGATFSAQPGVLKNTLNAKHRQMGVYSVNYLPVGVLYVPFMEKSSVNGLELSLVVLVSGS